MAVSALRRLAAGGRVRFLPLAGEGGAEALGPLALHPALEEVRTPRHATLLVLSGRFPARTHEAVQRIHDQIPHPRAAVRYQAAPLAAAPDAVPVGDDAGAAERLAGIGRDTVCGRRPSSRALRPDVPPTPWRGRGDHGQGGEGMMGGRPYGRPMATTGEDVRDGLALDRMPLRLGPFFPGLPPGLVLSLTLQGDVVQDAFVEEPPFAAPVPSAFRRVLAEPVPVVELERARAGSLLRRVATMLRVLGADAAAERARRAAANPTARGVGRLRKRMGGPLVRAALPEGRGRLTREGAAAWGGPTARAAGLPEDERSGSDVYWRLGFEVLVRAGGGVRARLLQRLAEAEQALYLARRAAAQEAVVGPLSRAEAPEGPIGPDAVEPPSFGALGPSLVGCEWGEAVAVLASFEPAPGPASVQSGRS